ncbi:MAG: hypothetical protein ACLR23_25515 [Clostridia bacterium]
MLFRWFFVAAAVGAAGYYVATSGQFAPFQEKVCKSFDLNMSAYEVFVDGQSVGIVEEADSAGQVWVQVVSEINSGEIHYQIPNTLSIEEVEAKPSSFIEPDKLETPHTSGCEIQTERSVCERLCFNNRWQGAD